MPRPLSKAGRSCIGGSRELMQNPRSGSIRTMRSAFSARLKYTNSPASLSELASARERISLSYRLIKIALCPQDRKKLHARIEQRFRAMLEQGFFLAADRLP